MPEQNPIEEKEYKSAPPESFRQDEGEGLGATKESPIKNIIITAIVSLVIFVLMSSFITPVASKKTYEADITRLETDLVAMREVETRLSDRIAGQDGKITAAVTKSDTTSNALASLATKAELSNYASVSTVNALDTIVQTLVSLPAILDQKLTDFAAELEEKLEDEVKDLNIRIDGVVGSGASSGTYGNNIYAEITEIDTESDTVWISVKANAPTKYALAIELWGDVITGFDGTHIRLPSDFKASKFAITTTPATYFITREYYRDSWDNQTIGIRIDIPSGNDIDFISARMVSMNLDR